VLVSRAATSNAARNDFGYTVGGPVKKDKVYFFWSEEWNRERRGRVHNHCVPTAAEFAGDFSAPLAKTLRAALPH